jgi:hypothetical protein
VRWEVLRNVAWIMVRRSDRQTASGKNPFRRPISVANDT